MERITISIPDELLMKFKKQFPEINVAEVARRTIIEKIKQLKKLEGLKFREEHNDINNLRSR
jgi:hypothetical protein